jgi:hypothetical protein
VKPVALSAVAAGLVVVIVVMVIRPTGTSDDVIVSPTGTPPVAHETRSKALRPDGRLFAADSVWNAPLSDAAPLDPTSGQLVRKLRETVAKNVEDRTGPWIQTSDTSTPLYVVPRDQRTVRVTLDAGAWATSLQQAFEEVPVPRDATPAAGPDGHMTVWQPSTDRLWEFFKARKSRGGWKASFGGAMANVSSSPGYYTAQSWPGLSHSYWGATATSLPVIGGTMRLSELRTGVIAHALAMNIPFARPNVFAWPAQRTDGASSDPKAIPEGARFRVDPTLELSTLRLPRLTRMMAEAAQRYGIIVRDQTAHAVAFFAEDPTPTGTDPYSGPQGLFEGHYPNELLREFPWERLQLLRMRLRSG